MLQRWVSKHGFDQFHVRRAALGTVTRGLPLRWLYHAAEPDVRPNDGGLGVAPQQVLHLRQVNRLLPCLGERHVDVAVQDHSEAHFSREIQNAVERWIGETRSLTGDL